MRPVSTIARRAVWAAAGALLLALLGLAAYHRQPTASTFAATDVTGVSWGRDFQLQDPTGQPRSLADYHDKVVLLFFGFTHCPDICPGTLAKMAQAMEQLGKDSERVQGLFVTLDPARDTPQVLARYASGFHPSFVGLSADAATIDATAAEFKLFFTRQRPDENGAYTVDHLTAMYVFDPAGKLRLYVRGDAPTEALVHDLRALL